MKTCCIDCPNHRVIPDPDPHDWFCDDDLAVICIKRKRKVDLQSAYAVDRQSFKPVTCGCRPYQIRRDSEIPKWCPLKKKKAKTTDKKRKA